jgi:hypothetical protein
LRAIAQGNPDAGDLLPRRMRALGLEPDELARTMPEVARDLERVCSHCASYGRCQRDLDHSSDGTGWKAYCPNAQTLEAIARR